MSNQYHILTTAQLHRLLKLIKTKKMTVEHLFMAQSIYQVLKARQKTGKKNKLKI